MAIRNTSHDGPSACLTSPECNSAKILRMPNLRAVNVGGKKSLATLNDMRMLGLERERNGICYFSHLCTKVHYPRETVAEYPSTRDDLLGNPGNDRTLMRISAPVVMDAVPAPGRKAALGSVAAVIPPALRSSSW